MSTEYLKLAAVVIGISCALSIPLALILAKATARRERNAGIVKVVR